MGATTTLMVWKPTELEMPYDRFTDADFNNTLRRLLIIDFGQTFK